MKAINQKVLAEIAKRGETWEPLYSRDHPSVHEHINFERVGIKKEQRVALGVKAPDMHKVIEHVFGQIKPKLHAALYRHKYRVTGELAQSIAKDLFMTQVTAASVSADVQTLPDTYRCIATSVGSTWRDRHGLSHMGTGGDWAIKGFR